MAVYISRHRIPGQQGMHTFQSLICTYYTVYGQINMVRHCVDILQLFQDSASTAQQYHQRFAFTTGKLVDCFSPTQNSSLIIQAEVFHPLYTYGVACTYTYMQIPKYCLTRYIKSGKHTVRRWQSICKRYNLYLACSEGSSAAKLCKLALGY